MLPRTKARCFEMCQGHKKYKVSAAGHGGGVEAVEVRTLLDTFEARHPELSAFAIPLGE